MKPQETIAQAFTLPNKTTIKNRLLKSAMSEGLGYKNGAPKPELSTLYGIWADGGIGISVTGNVMVDKRALGEPGNVYIENEGNLEALKKWAKAATKNDTHCWVQLNHPGKQSPKGLNKENVAPSAIPFRKDLQPFFATPRELTHEEILDIIQRFGTAAGIIKKQDLPVCKYTVRMAIWLVSSYLHIIISEQTNGVEVLKTEDALYWKYIHPFVKM